MGKYVDYVNETFGHFVAISAMTEDTLESYRKFAEIMDQQSAQLHAPSVAKPVLDALIGIPDLAAICVSYMGPWNESEYLAQFEASLPNFDVTNPVLTATARDHFLLQGLADGIIVRDRAASAAE